MKKLYFKKSWVFLPILVIMASSIFAPLFGGVTPPLETTTHLQNVSVSSVETTSTAQTSIIIKSGYTKGERVNQFTEKLLATTALVTKEEWTDVKSPVVDYVEFNNIPEDTKISLLSASVVSNDSDGTVSFSLSINQYFGADGVLKVETKIFSLSLILDQTYQPTTVKVNYSYPTLLTIDEFKSYVADIDGNVIPVNLSKFVHIDSLPAGSNLTIEWDSHDTEGNIRFKVVASSYYDANSDTATSGSFLVDLLLAPDNITTKPATKLTDFSSFPIDANATTIYTQIKSGTDDVNYAEISKFIDLATLPYEAVLTFGANASNNPNTGAVAFTLNSTLVYDGKTITPVAPTKIFSFSWKLKGKIPATNVSSITRISRNMTIEDFRAEVEPNQIVERTILSTYVDLTLVPEQATIILSNFDKNPIPGTITFTLTVNQYFNAESTIVYGTRAYEVQLNSLVEINQEGKALETWIYYVIGGAVLIVILLTVLITLKIRDQNNSKFYEFEKYEKEIDRIDPENIDGDKTNHK